MKTEKREVFTLDSLMSQLQFTANLCSFNSKHGDTNEEGFGRKAVNSAKNCSHIYH